MSPSTATGLQQTQQEDQIRGTEATQTAQSANAPSRSTYVRPEGRQAKARRRRPAEPDPNSIARGSLIDQIMRESDTGVPIFAPAPSAHPNLPDFTSGTAAAEGETVDNDEAAAQAFKEQFLKDMAAQTRRRPAGYSNAAAKGVEARGPKLGGSRAQREKMRAAQMQQQEASNKGGVKK
jgi:hypothetical protein